MNGNLSSEDSFLLGLPLRHGPLLTLTLLTLYPIVIVVGIVGNSLVLFVIFRNTKLRSVKYIFIANLAVADLLLILFVAPSNLLDAIFIPWILGGFICKIVIFLQAVSVSASVYSLVLISIERLLAIIFPLRVPLRRQTVRCLVACIWIYSLLNSTPYLFVLKLTVDDRGRPTCEQKWPSGNFEAIYFIATCLLNFVIPVLVISTCFVLIFKRVSSRRIPTDSIINTHSVFHRRVNISVLRMLLTVILYFFCAWGPTWTIYGWLRLAELTGNPEKSNAGLDPNHILSVAWPLTVLLACTNSCVNFIIYNFMNENFRREFRAVICRKRANYASTRYNWSENGSTNSTGNRFGQIGDTRV